MIMAGKWMVFDGAFNDGASASSSPIWMILLVDSIVGDSRMAFVRKVSLGNEHDFRDSLRKEGLFSVLLRVDEGRWLSRAQAEGMLPLFELGKDRGEEVFHGSQLFKNVFYKGFEVPRYH
jgi:hypothetical protein